MKLHDTLVEKNVAEERVLTDASLGLEEKAGLVKCWFVFDRRRRAVKLLQNEDLARASCWVACLCDDGFKYD